LAKDLKKQFENNRQLILETASKLFTQKGIMNTSFSDISKECKLSKGTIYYYYPSKYHLIYEVTDFHFKQATDAVFSWISDTDADFPAEEALKSLLESIFDTDDKCKLHVCLLNEAIMGNDALKKRFAEKYGEWKTMIEVGFMKTGPLPSDWLRAATVRVSSGWWAMCHAKQMPRMSRRPHSKRSADSTSW
jgi:AcrR family transcriptional regulator